MEEEGKSCKPAGGYAGHSKTGGSKGGGGGGKTVKDSGLNTQNWN